METALVIMAAGMGSRFKGGIKQLEPVGPSGEIIVDYSIYDALEAGFDRIVFIIRKDIEEAFHAAIGARLIKAGVKVEYVFQEREDIPAVANRDALLAKREKPWGTGHAVLACKDTVDCPFAVINSDDYYGKEAYRLLHQFLVENPEENAYCMAGFQLKNTMSDHGTVTRGVCQTSRSGQLEGVVETHNIAKATNGVDGVAEGQTIPGDTLVSMNMWGLKPGFFSTLEEGFRAFLAQQSPEEKNEYLLPTILGGLVESKSATVAVLPTDDKWFGVTYHEDKEGVVASIRALVESGAYPQKLFG
jgi:UTP-glucose-1-phosphate uridylyltransferase